MKKPIQLKEFQKLEPEKFKQFSNKQRFLNQIEFFNKKQGKQIIEVRRNGIKATSHVGIFSVGRETIQILPKISKDSAEDYSVKNLLHMLSYTRNIEITEAGLSRLCERKKSEFFEIIIYLFASNLLELLKKNFRKSYVDTEENSHFIKGRILFQENLKANMFRKDKIYCNFSDFSQDILLNQIFKYTSKLLTSITTDSENYRILREIDFILSEIEFKRIKLSDFKNLYLDRLNHGYKPIVDLAKLFISNSTVELSCNKLESFSFLFDMNLLFEQFIAGFIARNKNKLLSKKFEIKYQDKSKYLVDYPKSLFMLKPDLIIYSKETKLIIDTKYKILNPEEKKLGIAQSDLYQMVAYSLKHDCDRIVLLYPKHLIDKAPEKPYEIHHDGKKIKIFIRVVDLNIDMQTEKQKILDQLNLVFSCINYNKPKNEKNQ